MSAACQLLLKGTALIGDWYVPSRLRVELCVVRDVCPENVGLQPSYGTRIDGSSCSERAPFSIYQ